MIKDKVVLITGGSRGIGAAIVDTLANAGAIVHFTYRASAEQADAIVATHSANGNRVFAHQSDASNYSDAEALIKTVIELSGKVDVLINNAGVTRDTLMLRMSEEQWDVVMQNNLKSVFNLTKHVLRPMMKNRSGSIINIGSVVGIFGNAGQANYAASKAGIIGFSKSIAKEVGSRNIRCNVIAPGFIETEMTDALDEKTKVAYLSNVPLKRFGTGKEVADTCLWLSSDMAAYVTGQVISVCGGLNT
jgi:3-oxoacyl-[acyl-carrier protein] reductase